MYNSPISIDLPLRGQWFVEVSPADRVPSHGTDKFGLRYAFDFVQVDWQKAEHPTHDKRKLDYFTKGIPLENYYCFGKAVYAPFTAEVVTVEDSIADGKTASWLNDQTSAIRNSLFFSPKKDGLKSIAGNYVILKRKDNVYAVFAHLQKDSITVNIGDKIQKGQFIGKVGHSGNSTEPHLHFHLMNSFNPEIAQGLPFVFKQYEKYNGSSWQKMKNEIPTATERIRFKIE